MNFTIFVLLRRTLLSPISRLIWERAVATMPSLICPTNSATV